jgi:hypothetical protein
MEWLQEGVELVIRFSERLQDVTTNNYDSFTELHTPKITETAANIKIFSVFTSRCLVAASNGGRHRPQLPASHFLQM